MDVPAETTVDGLLAMLGIPAEEMKQTYVDSLRQEGGYVLKDGERVAVFPPIAGG
jgi:sulfur carrier protein ThiS